MRLAEALQLPFLDADDFHSASNKQKMANGVPLDDADRLPWLEKLAGHLSVQEKAAGAVMACSALKESYRQVLGSQCAAGIKWIVLDGSKALLTDRLASRTGHFFDPALLESQLQTLEFPDYGWRISIDASPEDIVNAILERLRNE